MTTLFSNLSDFALFHDVYSPLSLKGPPAGGVMG